MNIVEEDGDDARQKLDTLQEARRLKTYCSQMSEKMTQLKDTMPLKKDAALETIRRHVDTLQQLIAALAHVGATDVEEALDVASASITALDSFVVAAQLDLQEILTRVKALNPVSEGEAFRAALTDYKTVKRQLGKQMPDEQLTSLLNLEVCGTAELSRLTKALASSRLFFVRSATLNPVDVRLELLSTVNRVGTQICIEIVPSTSDFRLSQLLEIEVRREADSNLLPYKSTVFKRNDLEDIALSFCSDAAGVHAVSVLLYGEHVEGSPLKFLLLDNDDAAASASSGGDEVVQPSIVPDQSASVARSSSSFSLTRTSERLTPNVLRSVTSSLVSPSVVKECCPTSSVSELSSFERLSLAVNATQSVEKDEEPVANSSFVKRPVEDVTGGAVWKEAVRSLHGISSGASLTTPARLTTAAPHSSSSRGRGAGLLNVTPTVPTLGAVLDKVAKEIESSSSVTNMNYEKEDGELSPDWNPLNTYESKTSGEELDSVLDTVRRSRRRRVKQLFSSPSRIVFSGGASSDGRSVATNSDELNGFGPSENGLPDLKRMFDTGGRRGLRGRLVHVLGVVNATNREPSAPLRASARKTHYDGWETFMDSPVGVSKNEAKDEWVVCDTNNDVVKVFNNTFEPTRAIRNTLRWRPKERALTESVFVHPSNVAFFDDGASIVVKDDVSIAVFQTNETSDFKYPIMFGSGMRGMALTGNYVVTIDKAVRGLRYAQIQIYDVHRPFDLESGTSTPLKAYNWVNFCGERNHGASNPRFMDATGTTLAVTDLGVDRVSLIDLSCGRLLNTIGGGGRPRDDGQFHFVTGVRFDGSRNLVIGDAKNSRVQLFDSTGAFVCRLQLEPPAGLRESAQFVSDVHLTADGHLISASRNGHFCAVHKLEPI